MPLQMTGFVMVKKVPGTLHFHMKQEGISFAGADIDVSHVVNELTFGNRPSPKRRRTLARLHPMGLDRDWADKLAGTGFISGLPETTHEHYLQLVKTTLEPLSNKPGAAYDAYEYTVQSHSYVSELADVPAAKFTFQTSAMQVRARRRCLAVAVRTGASTAAQRSVGTANQAGNARVFHGVRAAECRL